jgi:signal transduction histidine kinase
MTVRKDLDQLREDMTSMIYHDLRSPLGNIVSSLDMLQDMIPPEETTMSILGIALNSTGRIQRLVNSLLDISRLESGHQVETGRRRPCRLIDGPSAMWNRAAGRAEHQLPLRAADHHGGCRHGHNVFINLLEVIKFTPARARSSSAAGWTAPTGSVMMAQHCPAEHERSRNSPPCGKEKPGGLGVGWPSAAWP